MYQNGPVFDYVKNMAITRGEFIAVNTTKDTLKAWQENKLTSQQRRDIKQQINSRKTFICPGKCGECTLIKENPHACGNLERFKDVKILIPIH
jgi:Zn ribbon nucleic-acid-binding protein